MQWQKSLFSQLSSQHKSSLHNYKHITEKRLLMSLVYRGNSQQSIETITLECIKINRVFQCPTSTEDVDASSSSTCNLVGDNREEETAMGVARRQMMVIVHV